MALEGDLQALLGSLADGRCHPIVNQSAIIIYPYITYQVVSKTTLNTLDGASGLTLCRVQIDVFATTYSAAKTLARSVGIAIAHADVTGVQIFGFEQFEAEANAYRVTLEYEIWSEE